MDINTILTNTYYGNTVKEWAISLLLIFGFVILAKFAYIIMGKVIKKLTAKTKTRLDDIFVDMFEEPAVFALAVWGSWYSLNRLTFSEATMNWIGNVYNALVVFIVAWFVVRFFDAIFQEYFVPLSKKTESDMDDQLMPIIRKGVKIIVWVIAIIVALNNAGYDVTALLAGLGIGGLALAMAAKDFVANIFGGIMILTDKPFKVGDRIKISGFDGNVEEIGLRSTRIRTQEGRVVTIPNLKFAEGAVENVTLEPSRKVVQNIGLTYDTTPKNIDKAMKLLKEIVEKHKGTEDKVIVTFNDFGASALNLMLVYYIKTGEDYALIQSEIGLEILEKFTKNKLEFAYPTQTLYVKQ